METNEIMVNEEVVNAVEEIVNTSSRKGTGFMVGVGLGVATVLAVEYLIKPFAAKRKAKKEPETIDATVNETDSTNNVEEPDETT